MVCMVDGYIGLLNTGLTEPPVETGYKRISAGRVNLWEAQSLLEGKQFVFPDVAAPGYGHIFCIGLFDAEQNGNLLYFWPLKESVDVHTGVTPGIVNGQLLRGIDVSAQVIASLKEAISATKSNLCKEESS